MRNGKKFLAMVLALTLIVSVAPFTLGAATGYADTKGHWAEQLINEWSTPEVGILEGESGYGKGNFYPNNPISTVELDLVLARLLGKPLPVWTKAPALTREAAAKVIATELGLTPVTNPKALFADDANIAPTYRPYVYALKDAGMICLASLTTQAKSTSPPRTIPAFAHLPETGIGISVSQNASTTV